MEKIFEVTIKITFKEKGVSKFSAAQRVRSRLIDLFDGEVIIDTADSATVVEVTR